MKRHAPNPSAYTKLPHQCLSASFNPVSIIHKTTISISVLSRNLCLTSLSVSLYRVGRNSRTMNVKARVLNGLPSLLSPSWTAIFANAYLTMAMRRRRQPDTVVTLKSDKRQTLPTDRLPKFHSI